MNNEDELQGFIEDDKCVSFRWFANVLCIPVEQAKTIMGTYRESHPDVFATYCVTGELKGKHQISIAIVPEEKLESCKNKYATVNHVHIYSLQKRKFAEMKGQLSLQLSAADTLQANDLLTQSNGQDTLLNNNGGIKLTGVQIQPVGHRISMPMPVEPSSSVAAENKMASAFATGSSRSSSSSSSSSSSKAPAKKEKPNAAVASFFASKKGPAATTEATITTTGSSSTTSDSTTTAITETDKKTKKTEKPVVAKSAANTFEGDDEEDEKFVNGPTRKGKTTDGEAAMDVDGEAVDLSMDTSPSGRTTSKGGKKKNLNVRGAMDDYFEDVAIEKFKATGDDGMVEGEEASSTSASNVVKRKKKKLVEKFFQDAKGYMVTENVWEDVTDDEGESAPVAQASSSSSSTGVKRSAVGDVKENDEPAGGGSSSSSGTSKAAPAAAAKEKAAPAAKKQKSASTGPPQKGMMSFFKKT